MSDNLGHGMASLTKYMKAAYSPPVRSSCLEGVKSNLTAAEPNMDKNAIKDKMALVLCS